MAHTTGATREAVRQWRMREPGATAADIARGLGVSRERVRQHLSALGLPTSTPRSRLRTPFLSPQRKRKEADNQSRIMTGGVPVKISSPVAGLIGELLAAADLTARGYTVYAPICRHTAHADLVALRRGAEGAPITIEVRCGHRRANGSIAFAKRVDSKATHHAVVITGHPVEYIPPL